MLAPFPPGQASAETGQPPAAPHNHGLRLTGERTGMASLAGAVRRARRLLSQVRSRLRPVNPADLQAVYVRFVGNLTDHMPHDEAMELAIGGDFEQTGAIEAGLVRHYGPAEGGYVIDVGCGSGRLAKPLSVDPRLRYLGIDLVPQLIEHARRITNRPDWRFEVIDHIAIPEAEGRADLVCFFSVLTHLRHEQGYWYLEEAKRVLKPGGRIVFSFLEFAEPAHWGHFEAALRGAKAGGRGPMDVFHDRNCFPVWAQHLGLEFEEIRSGGDVVVPEGNLGQALCVLRKPLA